MADDIVARILLMVEDHGINKFREAGLAAKDGAAEAESTTAGFGKAATIATVGVAALAEHGVMRTIRGRR